MKLNQKELTLFYHSGEPIDKQVLAYSTVLNKKLNKQDLKEVEVSTTILRTILRELNLKPKQLMDKSHPYYQQNLKGKDFDHEGWLHIIKKNPYLIKAPIAMYKNKVVLCENPYDVLRIES